MAYGHIRDTGTGDYRGGLIGTVDAPGRRKERDASGMQGGNLLLSLLMSSLGVDPSQLRRLGLDNLGIDLGGTGKDGGPVDFRSQVPGMWSGSSTVPEGWTEDQALTSVVNPEEAIRAQQPRIQEEMETNMASAAQRLGLAGTPISSSGYGAELGRAARGATNDIASIVSKYTYDAQQRAAAREHEADQARRNRSLSSWGQLGDWQYGAGQNDLNRSLDAWGQHGNWLMRAGEQDLQAKLGKESRYDSRLNMLFPLLRAAMEGSA